MPTLIRSAVLFLDILGTALPRTDQEAQSYLEITHRAFARAREDGDSNRGASEFTIATWFSDNLVMGMPMTGGLKPGDAVDLLAMYAAMHQLVLADEGLFCRGAITFGLFYADAEYVNGPALNDAYKLESTAANYPRVILAPSAMTALADGEQRDAWLAAGDDGVPFVDYLRYISYVTPDDQDEAEGLARHRDQIRAQLVRSRGNLRVEQKYAWLASYHDARVPSDLIVVEDRGTMPHFRLMDPGL
ncbi:hypothetical protein DSM104299_04418 [Baekduia alba]|uniref:hypothetical protein n=1 Tax=Baekduia alba TaxID=2997333 RepID=UPI00234085D8|nr:hypothetical protein [Baekduia alba]WCB95669.1 hypothetical protein DSM104299_04418 [Baekduia alba]